MLQQQLLKCSLSRLHNSWFISAATIINANQFTQVTQQTNATIQSSQKMGLEARCRYTTDTAALQLLSWNQCTVKLALPTIYRTQVWNTNKGRTHVRAHPHPYLDMLSLYLLLILTLDTWFMSLFVETLLVAASHRKPSYNAICIKSYIRPIGGNTHPHKKRLKWIWETPLGRM